MTIQCRLTGSVVMNTLKQIKGEFISKNLSQLFTSFGVAIGFSEKSGCSVCVCVWVVRI